MKTNTWLKNGIGLVLIIITAGCDTVGSRHHRSNGLFAYLYSDQTGHIDEPTIPVLSLPLRVGIAFVPPEKAAYAGRGDAVFAEKQKMDLMCRASELLGNHDFIKSVELIPSAYLTSKGGFENLEQLRRIYGIDVIVLLSYDQVQFTDQGLFSLSYWTIVGAYVVQGEKNDTKTMLDAAVYDIASRKLLFRAPGISEVQGRATPINVSEQLRVDSEKGFVEATTNLVGNLTIQLDEFKVRVKNAPTEYRIERKPGYTGSGAFGGMEIALVCGMGGCFLWSRKLRQT